jgi:hypothetical protein
MFLHMLWFSVTSFSLEKLFAGAPNMQGMVRILEEPGFLQVLLNSANSQEASPLVHPCFALVGI